MRRRIRMALVILAVPPLLVVVLLGALMILGNFDGGRRLIEGVTDRLTAGGVRLEGLAGRFPGELSVAHLELRDPQGLWLQADQVRLRWSPLPLLRRCLRAQNLEVEHIAMARAPNYPSSNPNSSGMWFRAIEIDHLDLARVELGAPLTGSAVPLRLTGSGRLVSLHEASLDLVAQRLDAVAATYRAHARFDAAQVQGQLEVAEGKDGPLSHLIGLPGLGALSLQMSLDGPRQNVQTRLIARADALQASAQGTLDLKTHAAVLDVTASGEAATLRPGLSWQHLALTGRWRGPLKSPDCTAHLELAGFSGATLQVDTLRADVRSAGAQLIVDGSASGLQLPSPYLAVLHDAPLQFHGEWGVGDPSWPVAASISHPRVTARAQMQFGKSPGATISAEFADLKPASAMIGLNLAGHGSGQAQLRTEGHVRRLDISTVLDVSGGAAPIAPLLEPHATVALSMALSPGRVEIVSSQIDSPHARVAAHGEVGGPLALAWTAPMIDMSALSETLAGHVSSTGKLEGQVPRLTLTAEASGQISVQGAAPGDLRLRAAIRDLPQEPTGRFELSGVLDQAPLELIATASRSAEGAFEAHIEHGDWKSVHAQGTLRADAAAHVPRGQLELKIGQLSDFNALTGQKLQGSADASVQFEDHDHGGRAQVAIEATDLALPNRSVDKLSLRGTIDSPLDHPVLALQLSAHGKHAGVAATLDADARGPLERLQLHTKLSAGEAPSAASADVLATFDAHQRVLQIASLTGSYRQQALQLLSPATINFAGGVALDGLRLRLAQAQLSASGKISPALDLHAALSNVSDAWLRLIGSDLEIDGHIDAEAQLAGTLDQPTGTIKVTGQGLRARSGAARGLPAAELAVSAQLASPTATITAQLNAGERVQLKMQGRVPLSSDAPIDLAVNGKVALRMFNSILEARGERMLGDVDIDAKIGGTASAPSASGSLTLSGGDIQDYGRGLHLREVGAKFAADGGQVTLQQFTATAGSGSITASGTLGLLTRDMPVNLTVTARNAQPLATDLLTANVDADLKLSGTLQQALTASGTVHIKRADINIPNALPPNVDELNVVRAGQAPPPPAAANRLTVNWDLRVDAPRAVFVRGRGLDTELAGALHFGGTSADPDISGGFDMRSGTVNLAGATLGFNSGRLSFNGTGVRRKIDPTLEFTASNYSGGITSTLTITGYADAPVIVLSSTPDMPQDEVLSHLLFGVSVTQLSPLQIAQIGAALASMSGIGGNALNPLNAVQRKLRLDRLAVSGGGGGTGTTTAGGAAQNNSTTVEAGRYITPRVYIGARQISGASTQAQVQIDLTKKLKLQSTIGAGGGTVQGATPQNDPGSNVGISYGFEY